MDDKKEKTIYELNQGLKYLVSVMLMYRRQGKIKLVSEMQKHIYKVIECKDLDAETVYFCYGNPDDPAVKNKVYMRAEILEMVY